MLRETAFEIWNYRREPGKWQRIRRNEPEQEPEAQEQEPQSPQPEEAEPKEPSAADRAGKAPKGV